MHYVGYIFTFPSNCNTVYVISKHSLKKRTHHFLVLPISDTCSRCMYVNTIHIYYFFKSVHVVQVKPPKLLFNVAEGHNQIKMNIFGN